MTEIEPRTEAIGRNALQPLETGTKNRFDAFLSIPFVEKYVVPHLGKLVNLAGDHPSFNGGILYALGSLTRETPLNGPVDSIPLREARKDALRELAPKKISMSEAENAQRQAAYDAKRSEGKGTINDFFTRLQERATGRRTETPPELRERRKQILERERERRRLTKELYSHSLREIESADYGKIGAQVSILNPDVNDRDPIVLITGSSNDPESMESFAVAKAIQSKRKVIILGYPDAPNGRTSPLFEEAVKRDVESAAERTKNNNPEERHAPEYKPYVDFFGQLIKQEIPDGNFSLIGHSGGSAISAILLNNPDFGNRVTDATLYNPGGSTTFSVSSETPFMIGNAAQGILAFTAADRYPRFTWWDDPRSPNPENRSYSPDKASKLSSWMALGKGSHYRIPEWETAKVKDGGKITVVSGGLDTVTRSAATFSERKKPDNPQLQVYFDPFMNHNSILTRPDEIIADVEKYQETGIQPEGPLPAKISRKLAQITRRSSL